MPMALSKIIPVTRIIRGFCVWDQKFQSHTRTICEKNSDHKTLPWSIWPGQCQWFYINYSTTNQVKNLKKRRVACTAYTIDPCTPHRGNWVGNFLWPFNVHGRNWIFSVFCRLFSVQWTLNGHIPKKNPRDSISTVDVWGSFVFLNPTHQRHPSLFFYTPQKFTKLL